MSTELVSGNTKTITGYGVRLDGDDGKRSVWLGKYQESYCIIFTNAEGCETRIVVSPEALDALVRLHKEEDEPDFLTWRFIMKNMIGAPR